VRLRGRQQPSYGCVAGQNSDTAELFALLRSMEDSDNYSFGKILDVSELDPTHQVSLTIH